MKKYLRYVYALLAVPLAILLHYALMPLIGHGVPYVSLFIVTGSVAVLGGLIPAVITAVFGAIATDYFFIEPLYTLHFSITFISQMSVVVLTNAFIGYIGDQLRTARKKAESQSRILRESREDLYHAQSVGNIGSWRLDINRNILTWSDENYRIFGISKGSQMSYETFLGTIHPDDREYVDAKWKAGLAGENYDIEHRIIADGKIKWVREKAYLEFDSKGNLLGGFGITQDITDRKKAEEELRSERVFVSAVLETAGALVVVLDQSGRIVRFNRACEKVTGYSFDEVKGKCFWDFLLLPEEIEPVKNVFTKLRAGQFPSEFENFWVTKKKARRLIHWTNTCLTNSSGEVEFVIATGIDFTDRHQAEEALRQSEQRLRLAQTASNSGSWEWDLITNENIWSDELWRLYGLEPHSCKPSYEAWKHTIHPDDLQKTELAVQEAAQKGTELNTEWRVRHPDGEEHWLMSRGQPLRDSKGKIVRYAGIVIDITDRKRSEEALLKAKQEWERTFNSVPDMIAILDERHRIIQVNRAMAKQLRKEPKECIGLRCHSVVHSSETPPSFCPHSQTLADGMEHIAEIYDKKNGRNLLVSTTPWLSADGKVIGSVHVSRDITDSKRAEEEIRNLARFPEENPNPVLRISKDGVIIYSNSSGDTLLKGWGCKRNGTVPERWRKLVVSALETNSTKTEDCDCDECTGVVYSIAIAPVVETGYANLYARDVTKEREAEKLLINARNNLEKLVRERTEELQQRAEQLVRLTSELTLTEHRERQQLAQVLHDHLQQILVGAKIQVELLLRRVGKDEKHDVKHIIKLLNESIAASRSLTAELSPPIPRDAGLITGLEWLTRWMKEKYGLTVILETDEQYNVFREDLKILLFQAVRELLINVMKHSEVLTARIELAQHDPENLRIAVSDNGVGFDHKTLLSDENRISGGFGLFSIRERLSTLGGRMEISSTPGEGSCFTLIVPTKNLREKPVDSGHLKYAEYKKAQDRTAITASVLPIIGRKIRILLVDDHIVMRQGLSRLLKEETDLEVIGEASNGAEAIEKSIKLQPDVILMDYNMPDIDGAEATRLIHAKAPHIRIIGLSMYQEPAQTAMMMDAGAVAYLAKSDKPESLLDAIRRSVNIKS